MHIYVHTMIPYLKDSPPSHFIPDNYASYEYEVKVTAPSKIVTDYWKLRMYFNI